MICRVACFLVAVLGFLPALLPASRESQPAAAPGKILRVGVRRLPENLSPSQARTDQERRALDLLFEGLERLVPGPEGMSLFRPGLALGPAEAVPPLGHTFRLPADARWSDGKAILTAADVRESWRLLRDGHLGWSPAYADRLEEPNPTEDWRFTLRLTQGVLEPHAFARFPILPGHAGDVTEVSFARNPVGSGRFRFKSRNAERVVLEANPFYASRPGKNRLPELAEIHFVLTDNPVEALKTKKIDIALDLRPADRDAVQATAPEIQLLPRKGQRASNRRIYFLAIHCGKGPLNQVEMRRALAHALPVERLLNGYRGKAERAAEPMPHQALTWREPGSLVLRTSPFPRGSWPEGKEELAAGAKDVKMELECIYPIGDPVLAEIMRDLETELKTAGMTLKPVAKPEAELVSLVEKGDYQIAYYHYDYPDETFWLAPLLGPRGPHGQGNIFHYDSRAFETLLQQIDGKRDFVRVQQMMRQAHAKFATDVPFIPLWQLDPVIGANPGVPIPDIFDPLYLFSDPDRLGWKP